MFRRILAIEGVGSVTELYVCFHFGGGSSSFGFLLVHPFSCYSMYNGNLPIVLSVFAVLGGLLG